MPDTNELQDIRVKFRGDELVQWRADLETIQGQVGRVPYKYVFLMAVHRWAEAIRLARGQPAEQGE